MLVLSYSIYAHLRKKQQQILKILKLSCRNKLCLETRLSVPNCINSISS